MRRWKSVYRCEAKVKGARQLSAVSTPSSSLSSRMRAASGASPSWTLPPGNSHRPAMDLPSGRRARRTRPSASTSATAATRTSGRVGSAPVGAIDVDIAVGQVAGPHGCPPAPDPDIDRDLHLAPGDVSRDRRLVIAGPHLPAFGHLHPADRNGEAVGIGLLARLADRHDD